MFCIIGKELCRKDLMAKNIKKKRRQLEKEGDDDDDYQSLPLFSTFIIITTL